MSSTYQQFYQNNNPYPPTNISLATIPPTNIPLPIVPRSNVSLPIVPRPNIPLATVPSTNTPLPIVPRPNIPLATVPRPNIPLAIISPNNTPLPIVPRPNIPLATVPRSNVSLHTIPQVNMIPYTPSNIPLSNIPKPNVNASSNTEWNLSIQSDRSMNVSGLNIGLSGIQNQYADTLAPGQNQIFGSVSSRIMIEPPPEYMPPNPFQCEGYWDPEDALRYRNQPKIYQPIISRVIWRDKQKFVQAVNAIEKYLIDTTQVPRYGSGAISRINFREFIGGSEFNDYEYKICWPSGYVNHYIEQHNVMPTKRFFDYVLIRVNTLPEKYLTFQTIY